MLRTFLLALTTILLAWGLASCEAAATGTPVGSPPQAVEAAAQKLSEDLDVPLGEIETVSYSREDWSDACLGLAEPGEMCAQVITPGWLVVLRAQGQQYVYRTDQSGDVVRRVE